MKEILIVDDDRELSELYKIRLNKAGFQTSVVFDGQTALKFLKKTKPDLVILDLMIPKIGGDVVLKKIKKDDELKTIPVIIFSALDDQKDRVKLAQAYLIKSKTLPEDLLHEIKKLI